MTTPQPDPRRVARVLARAGVVGCGAMLAVSAFGLSAAGLGTAGAAGTDSGTAMIIHPFDGTPDAGDPITSGTSVTPFSLLLPDGAACPGDSATDGFNVTSFMVPDSVDPAGLQFDPITGPVPNDVGATFRQPLYEVGSGSAVTGRQTANADPAPGPGPVINIPGVDLSSAGFEPGHIPAGTYKLGIACIKGGAATAQLSNFWTARLVIATAAAGPDNPAGITFTVPAGGTTTTTSGGGTTSTTVGGATTSTTVSGGSTTTTAAGGSTTSTLADDGTTGSSSTSTSSTLAGGVSANPLGDSLPRTGASPVALVMWGFFLLVCGRLAIVLGRPPQVKTPRP